MRTIILFARAPQRGRVKTRLACDIGDEAALSLYIAMLRDSLEKAAMLARMVGGEAVLAHTPHDAMELSPQDGAPSLCELWSGKTWPQPEGDLGAKMHAAIEWAFGRGATSACLLGADVPDVNLDVLALNFDEMHCADSVNVILEPARDGGFWTLMCDRILPPQAFELYWNRSDTCAPLQANLQVLGLKVRVGLELGDDVDDLPALQRLAERLRHDSQAAPYTSRWLREKGFAEA